jgi:excinuclease ABC subunit A
MNMQNESIELRGVRTHNLQNIDLRLPLGQLSVVTGVSGSGKSSLVFDTLYGESYRRYVESLSSYARQYLKQLPKPDLDEVLNLPPAIAVKQAKSGLNQRSTVGTMTEINDILRILFGHLAKIICCGEPVEKSNGRILTQDAFQRWPGQRILFLASMEAWGKIKANDLKQQLETQGFTRCFLDGEVQRIDEVKAADLKRSQVVVDRIQLQVENRSRCLEAAELTLRLGRGEALLVNEQGEQKKYYKILKCRHCLIEYQEPSPTLFNYNHPLGACESCQGFGRIAIKDRQKMIPDLESSLLQTGVAPWNFGEHDAMYKLARKSAEARGMDPGKAFKKYSAADWQWLYEGDAKGRFDGINGYFTWLDSKKYKAHYRIHSARFHTYVLCPSCEGIRLNKKVLVYSLQGRNFADLSRITIHELEQWFLQLGHIDAALEGQRQAAAQEAVQEGQQRLAYLLKMGLGYLSLGRSARTLSGGEVQRINMSRSLGSALTGTLFCLDEPSVGLHARDSQNLLAVILELRDQGNTIVVVEHEKTLVQGAEYLVEVGPGAGHLGGQLVFHGSPQNYHKKPILWPPGRELLAKDQFLEIKNARTHNLKGVDASFLMRGLNVVCGVSGSGKTSLVRHTLYPMLAAILGDDNDGDEKEGSTVLADEVGPPSLIKAMSAVHFVSQEGIGRSSRSTIATYLGLYDEVRKILTATPEAKAKSLKPGFFSFNVPGGRCEHCKGLGYNIEDLSFLGEMPVTCPICQGRQFTDEALAILYRDRSLLDILHMTITQAREFFFDQSKLKTALDQVIGMGLGYVTLGQNTSSFSGGEAQRLKLLRMMQDAADRKPGCLIFDEPSTGLSDADVEQLLYQLLKLRDLGHTIVVVEHHMGFLQAADWLIEIGPEAAGAGGNIVYQGPPIGLKKVPESRTAPFLYP